MPSESPIRTQDLTKRFRHTRALDGVSLTLEPGEVFGYLGPNGAGKTTTIRILMGMLRPTSGRAMIFDHDTWREAQRVHRLVGYVPGSRRCTRGSPARSTSTTCAICADATTALARERPPSG